MDPPAEYNFARRGLNNMSMGNSPPRKEVLVGWQSKDDWDPPQTPCPCFTEGGLNKAIEALEKESEVLLRQHEAEADEDDNRLKSRLVEVARRNAEEAHIQKVLKVQKVMEEELFQMENKIEEVVSERGSSPEGAPNGPIPQADAEMSPKSRANMNAVLAKMQGKHEPVHVTYGCAATGQHIWLHGTTVCDALNPMVQKWLDYIEGNDKDGKGLIYRIMSDNQLGQDVQLILIQSKGIFVSTRNDKFSMCPLRCEQFPEGIFIPEDLKGQQVLVCRDEMEDRVPGRWRIVLL
jgi:hypothetical protein